MPVSRVLSDFLEDFDRDFEPRSNTDGSILMDEGNLSYINNDGLVDWGGGTAIYPVGRRRKHGTTAHVARLWR